MPRGVSCRAWMGCSRRAVLYCRSISIQPALSSSSPTPTTTTIGAHKEGNRMLTRAVVVNRGGGVLLLREAVQTASAASRRRPLHHLTHYASAAAAVGAAAEMPMGSSRGLPRPLVAGAEAVAALWWRPLSSQAATNHHAVEETEASALPHQREQPQPQPGPALVPQQQYQYVQQDPLQDGAMAPREGLEQKVSVMAFYVGQKLDLISVVQHNFLSHRGYKISDDILLVPLARGDGDPAVVRSALVVFKHGSVVFFNVEEALQSRYLHALARHCGEVVPQAHRFRETLECRLRPWQEKYHEMGQDVVNLRELKEDAIKVVSDVIGHSVALNFYNQKADRMLEDFRVLNNAVEGSGVFTEMDKKDLFKLVALNNKILTDAMSSGLLEQSKPAWNYNRLDALWNDLRDEFSIGERFAKVEHKINHVQSNTKFFLEILNHQKSNKLEWIIIVLISAEIVISCADLYHQLLG